MATPKTRRDTLWGAAALALALGVLLHESLFLGKGLAPADGIFRLPPWKGLFPLPVSNYLLSDQYLSLLPLRHFTSVHGLSAFWNPYISCGAPSIGSMQASAFYPINLLLLFLDPFSASGPGAFLKLFIAGFFTLLYLRKLGLSTNSALYGAISFSLSGFMIVWLGHPHTNTAAFLPATLYFLECGLAGTGAKHKRPWALAALCYGAMILGGHVPTIIQLSLWVAAYILFRVRQSAKTLGLAALALAGGVLLAAPQLLPYIEYYRLGSTAEASRNSVRWETHLPFRTLTHLITPLISGSPAHHFESLGAALGVVGGPNESFNERAGWVGVLSLFLAGAALLKRKNGSIKFFAASTVICLWIIYGLPPTPSIIKLIPLLNAINQTRLLLIVCFSLSALAAFGLEELPRFDKFQACGLLVALGLSTALFAAGLWVFFSPYWPEFNAGERGFLMKQLPVFFGAVLAASAAIILRQKKWTATLCVAWTSLELLSYGIGYNPALPRALYYPTTKAIEFLQKKAGPLRIMGIGWTLPPDTGIIYGLSDVRGQDYTTVRRYEELINGSAGQYFFYTTAQSLPASFAALGAKYVLAPNDWKVPAKEFKRVYHDEISIYQAPGSSDRARLFSNWEVVAPEVALAKLRSPGFDPDKTLLLEENPGILSGGSVGKSTTRVTFSSYETDEVTLRVESPRPGLLLLRDTYFPGWKATVGGRKAAIYRADYNFRAVVVPAGASEVIFTYKPGSVYFGMAVGLAAIIVLVGMALADG